LLIFSFLCGGGANYVIIEYMTGFSELRSKHEMLNTVLKIPIDWLDRYDLCANPIYECRYDLDQGEGGGQIYIYKTHKSSEIKDGLAIIHQNDLSGVIPVQTINRIFSDSVIQNALRSVRSAQESIPPTSPSTPAKEPENPPQ